MCETAPNGQLALYLNQLSNLPFLALAFYTMRKWKRIDATTPFAIWTLLVFAASVVDHAWVIQRPQSEILVLGTVVGFVVSYLYFVYRDLLAMRTMIAAISAALALPLFYVVAVLLQSLSILGSSAIYLMFVPCAVMFVVLVQGVYPQLVRQIGQCVALLLVGILARQLDPTVCAYTPTGSHFLWHLLSAAILYKMIDGYMQHRLAASAVRS